jgi:hypothetical protein
LLISTKGAVVLSVIAVYKALGGGWEMGVGRDFVSEETKREMQARTNWGDLLTSEEQTSAFKAAADNTEQERGWWRWRLWWPQW